jgi:hypothetical protein
MEEDARKKVTVPIDSVQTPQFEIPLDNFPPICYGSMGGISYEKKRAISWDGFHI